MKTKARLTYGPVGKKLFHLTIPMVAGIFAITAFNLADAYFVAKLGTRELAALSFTFPVVMLIGAFTLGLGMGASSVISRAIGEGSHEKVKRHTTDSLFLGVFIVAVFVAIGMFTIDPLFRFLGAGEEVLPYIRDYMTIWYFGMVMVVVPMIGNNAIRASGNTKFPAFVMITAAGINVILDPIFIFGKFGIPRMEIAGAALATVIGRTTTMTLTLAALHFRERMLEFSIPRLKPMLDSWKKILYIGLPAAGTNIFIPLSIAVVTRIVSVFGESAVAAVGAGFRVESFAMMVIMALSAVLIPFIGQNWGAGFFERVRLAHKNASLFSFFWGAFTLLVFVLTAPQIARLFSDDPKVIQGIIYYLYIAPAGYGLYGITILACAAYNAINYPLRAAGLHSFRMFILYIPCAWLGARLIGLRGVFAGVVVANILSGLVSLYFIRHTLNRHNAEKQPEFETRLEPVD